MRYLLLYVLALGLVIASCDDDMPGTGLDVPSPGDEVIEICIVERGCFTDQFYQDSDNIMDHNKHQLVQDYMQDQGLQVFGIQTRFDFFEGVCEACHVCPSGDVFSVRTNAEAREALLSQNIWLVDCLNEVVTIELSYHATKCANPWMTYLPDTGVQPTDEDIALAVIRYFTKEGADLFEVSTYQASPELCESCACLDDYGIRIRIDRDHEDLARNLGFQ